MNPEIDIWVVSILLITVLVLLMTEKITVDRTAIGIMVILALTGILTPEEVVTGFANSAVITVAAMFLISQGLIRTGAVSFISASVVRFSKQKHWLGFFIILIIVGVTSAFINNTPVVVLFIPIVMSLSCDFNFSPSKMLIPISYISILAGTCTLIGTSTNIIISDLSAAAGYGGLNMFELSILGVPIAVIGLILLMTAGIKMMPSHTAPVCELKDSEKLSYLAEFNIPAESDYISKIPSEIFAEKYPSVKLIELVRKSRILESCCDWVELEEKDILLVKGSADDLVALLKDEQIELPHSEQNLHFGSNLEDDLVVELIVPPQSSVLRDRLLSTDLQDDSDVQIIGVKSRGIHYSEQKIKNATIRIGDIILVRCSRKKLDQIRKGNDFIIVEDVHHNIVEKKKARLAFFIFAGVVFSATTGMLNIMISAISGVFLMAVTGCLKLKDAYRSLQPEVLLLIVGTIALGQAMDKTGASQLYAENFLKLFHGLGPGFVLAGFIILCSICTHILSNNATAVLLMPIAISTALTLGVNPKPFIIGICFGASACFATPIGYQTNLLVYSPGGYRFMDYFKFGIFLNLLVIVMASICIPWIWHF
ncbi:MAG: SLC13/DASS family transporter [Desulfobacterales bacterium]|nr:SLC13/DASS family transporter [Desulfobacterales bacterium]